jgi:putative addiction module antidote
MSKPIKIRRIGNSLGVTLSEAFREMGLQEGDQLYAVRTPNGIELTPYDPDFAEALESARAFMRAYPNAMKTLAS